MTLPELDCLMERAGCSGRAILANVESVIVDVPRKAFHLASHVNVRRTRIRIDNIIVVGDRQLGLTAKREVVIGQLTPDVVERENVLLEMEPLST